MSQAGRIFSVIAGVAAILFAALIMISLGWLSPEGLSNFDARILGYDVDEARAYLAVLPDANRALYLGLFRWIDTVFPVLVAVAIAGAMWLNQPKAGVFRRITSMALALAYLILDLAENAFVAQMLRSDGPVAQELVDRCSEMTQFKWFFLALSIVFVVVMWRRQKGEPA